MHWKTQFSEAFDVPAALSEDKRFKDTSWRHDVSPSFEVVGNDEVRLWADHPDADRRELGGARYVVTVGNPGDVVISTDDLQAAIAAAVAVPVQKGGAL